MPWYILPYAHRTNVIKGVPHYGMFFCRSKPVGRVAPSSAAVLVTVYTHLFATGDGAHNDCDVVRDELAAIIRFDQSTRTVGRRPTLEEDTQIVARLKKLGATDPDFVCIGPHNGAVVVTRTAESAMNHGWPPCTALAYHNCI